MKKLAAATLCAVVGSTAFAANLADVNRVVERIRLQGTVEQSTCDPPSHSRYLSFENVVINGQRYNQLTAQYLTGVNTSNRALVFGFLRKDNGKLYVNAIGDGEDVGTKLDGQPDVALERTFDPSNKKDLATLALLFVDPCSFEKSLETAGTKPDERQRQLYDTSVHFVLSR